MRRWMVGAAVVGALVSASPRAADAQLFQFYGCDGQRSCHAVDFEIRAFADFGNRAFVTGSTTWLERGAFDDCGLGCAWNLDNWTVIGDPSDLRHASNFCTDIWIKDGAIGDAWCLGDDPWQGGIEFTVPLDWRPEGLHVNIVYEVDGVDNPFKFYLTQVVPEPATAILLGVGLVLGGLITRHRLA